MSSVSNYGSSGWDSIPQLQQQPIYTYNITAGVYVPQGEEQDINQNTIENNFHKVVNNIRGGTSDIKRQTNKGLSIPPYAGFLPILPFWPYIFVFLINHLISHGITEGIQIILRLFGSAMSTRRYGQVWATLSLAATFASGVVVPTAVLAYLVNLGVEGLING